MSNLEQFKIDLKSLEGDDNVFSFDLDEAYFGAIEAPMVSCGKLCANVKIHRGEGFFSIDFHTEGTVVVACDVCLDDMDQDIVADNHLVVKFGEGNSEEDDLVIVDENEGILDLAWYIYEFIELNIPLRHVHAPGKCNPAMMKILEEHSAARSGAGDGEQAVDSRWEALSKLKIKE